MRHDTSGRHGPLTLRPAATPMDGQHWSRRAMWISGVLFALFTCCMVGFLVRVAQLQLYPAGPIAGRVDSQITRHDITARRGTILDRRGRELAVSHVTQRLFADSDQIQDPGIFPVLVAHHLDYDPVQIAQRLSQRPFSRYIVLDPAMEESRLAALGNVRLPGLASHPVVVREYPYNNLAGQVIGFIGTEGDGLEGLERAWNNRLAGHHGRIHYLRDAWRAPLWIDSDTYDPPVDGRDVRLAIDATLQAIAERHLRETVEHYRAASGQIIVLDPQTGEILAMANAPFFDPGDFRHGDPALRRNRAVTDVFEPGSIFKPIVWAALTEMGAARPDEKFDTTTAGVKRLSFGRRLRDARPQGLLTWEQVLMRSSNIGMAEAALRISHVELRQVLERFGFGQPTGSGLPGEVSGQVTTAARWNNYSQSSVPMGQEVSVTALQMVRAFATLANDGLLVTPTIEAIREDEAWMTPVSRRVLSAAVARQTRYVLRQAITEGTGRRANSDLYAIFGKTGTAQLPDFVKGGYHDNRYIASFLAGAPVDQPRLVIGCFIHDPDRAIGHFGGIVAAPPVMKILEESLLYLGVPMSADAEDEKIRQVVERMRQLEPLAAQPSAPVSVILTAH